MAEHSQAAPMVRESLPEYARLARIGIKSIKPESGGVLGYPAATLLFAIIDIIGGYCRGQKVSVKDKPDQIIGAGWMGFFVLNHSYFGYSVEYDQFRKLYERLRNPLTHNGLLAPGVRISVVEEVDGGIAFSDDGWLRIYLPALADRCERAIGRFLSDSDRIVDGSAAVANLYAKLDAKQMATIRATLVSEGWGQAGVTSAMQAPGSENQS